MIAHIFYVGVLSIWLYCSSAMTQEVLHPDRFVFGVKGTGTCSDGEVIMDKETCETACKELNLQQKTLLGNHKCYKDGQGNCYQNGENGGGASIICQKSGKSVASGCVDSDKGLTDNGGDTCEWYNKNVDKCGRFDDEDFTANNMCCGCGGGMIPPAGGWYVGGILESCDTACQGHDLVCSKEGYKNHHSDVDSSNSLRDLIEQLGGKLSTQSCNEANFAAVPNFNSDSCAFASKPDLHDCTKVPGPQGAKKQRLCYCQPSEQKSTIVSNMTTEERLKAIENKIDQMEKMLLSLTTN